MPPTDAPTPVADAAPPRSSEATAQERRRYRRFWVGLNVRVYWQDAEGRQRDTPALLRDVSAGGFGIEMQDSLEVGALITVRTMVTSPRCEVRHVQVNEKYVVIGVKVLPSEDGSRHEDSLEKLAAALAASRRMRRGG